MRAALTLCLSALAAVCVAGADALTDDERKSAQKLYNSKCAGCHKFYNPADYTRAEWDGWMKKMSRKSRLKPEQEELLARYFETFRTPAATNAPAKPKSET